MEEGGSNFSMLGAIFAGKSAMIDLIGEAAIAPKLLEGIPEGTKGLVKSFVLPSSGDASVTAEHFLLGPKGYEPNPTCGSGIRLAQFGSDDALGMMFCDGGILDFWIDPEDLAAGHWDKAWAATAGG